MRRILLFVSLTLTSPALAQVGPSTAPSTRLTPTTVAVRSPLGAITPASGPVAVPYVLSQTNHLIVRLKINGHGPYNFVVDTGAPTLLVDETIAQQIGLHPRAQRGTTRPTTAPLTQGWATIDRLDIEGGLSMAKVKCLVLTPYQITGMNAIGAAGMELHGLMGYSVLARFRMDIDLSKHRMLWTPQPPDFVPPPIQTSGPAVSSDAREDRLESLGGVLKFLGPLVKSQMPGPPTPRGWLGIELVETPGRTVDGGRGAVSGTVSAASVYPGSPAALGGLTAGPILAVDGHEVHSIAEVEARTSQLLPGQKVVLNVGPVSGSVHTTEKVDGDTRTTVTTITNVSRLLTITCGEGL